MSKILKYIMGYIAFTITFAFMMFYSAFPENDPHNILYSSDENHDNTYSSVNNYNNTYDDNDGLIVFAIVFCLIFISSYYIARKLIQKEYSRLKVRFIFATLVSLEGGIAIKISLTLSDISMNFMYILFIMLLLGAIAFRATYGRYGNDLLDFNRKKGKTDWKKTWKDIFPLFCISLIPLLTISFAVLIIFLLS
jgi:hypothetical protein